MHKAVTTGTEDQKFGLSIASGAADSLARRIRGLPSLELAGVHCHLGSQITSLDSFTEAARRLVAFMAGLGGLGELNLGGGHAVPYRPGDQGLDIAAFAGQVTGVVGQECAAHGIPVPRLTVEPGRAIAGPGRGDAVPGAHREARHAHLRRGGRRHERQPAARAVRQPLSRRAGRDPGRGRHRADDGGRPGTARWAT